MGAWPGERACQRTAIWDPRLDTTPPAPLLPLLCFCCIRALRLSGGREPSVPCSPHNTASPSIICKRQGLRTQPQSNNCESLLGSHCASFTITSSFQLPTTLGGSDSRNARGSLNLPQGSWPLQRGARVIGSLAPETQCVMTKPPTPLLRQRWARLVSPTPHFTGGETEAWRGKVWPEVRRELRRASRPPGSLTSVLVVLGSGAGSCRTSPPPPALSWCPVPPPAPGPGRRALLTLGHIRTVGPLTLEGLGSKGTPRGLRCF